MKKNYKALNGLVLTCLLSSVSFVSSANQYVVNNTNDVGAGSLNAAITLANNNPGLDTIAFNLPEGFSMTIAPTTPFPAITDAVFIDGYSQPGAAAGTVAARTIRVNIDGVGLPFITDIFRINTTGVTIAGLAIYRSPNFASGIKIEPGANAFIWGNYIGTDSTGLSTGLGNTYDGVVSNNVGNGTANTGVIVGTNGDGTGDGNEGNLISCNGEDAVIFFVTTNSKISGNVIGFNKNGVGTGFGNGRNGILATDRSNSNFIGTDGNSVSDNVEGNRIGNCPGRGIFLASISNSNVIAGNIIGLDATNAAAPIGTVPSNSNGIEINPGSNNRIGTDGNGTSDAIERNTICAVNGNGIQIVGGNFFGASNSDGNIIAGNAIGTNGAGTLVMGNTNYGIYITTNNGNNANNNIIGSNEDGSGDDLEANLIANNARGIIFAPPTAPSTIVGTRISRNSFFDNTQLGIDLNGDGTTPNDNGDPDVGPNDFQNFPFIKKSNVQGGNLVISGVAPAGAIIEFYIADASGAEGRTYLFSAQEGTTYTNGITDDSTGTDTYNDVVYGTGTDEKFGFTVPVSSLATPVTAGTVIISLAINTTTSVNSTSEFGPNFISTLPVRFTQFNGRVDNGIVYLDWNTSQEVNNSHFEIERSNTGAGFQKIGNVTALGGINNNYAYTDSKPGVVNFYRLKQVDKNGAVSYSKVLLIRSDLDKITAKVSPNPFVGAMNVSFQLNKQESVTVRLYNQTGQLVKQQITKANAGLNTINVGDLGVLPAGNYTIELKSTTINFRQQVVKQ